MENIYREKAISEVIKKLATVDNYEVDRIAREIFELPKRPENSKPFVGWMTPIKKVPDQVPSGGLRISKVGIALIKRWEGYSSYPYKCPAGVLTIGYGHTRTANKYKSITKELAEKLLLSDLVIYENGVKRAVKVDLSQNEYDALVSFTYNLGVGAFCKSSLLKNLNWGKRLEAARWFDRYVYAGKVKLPGLVLRRKAEKELFLGIS